jgi:hypothetical protein
LYSRITPGIAASADWVPEQEEPTVGSAVGTHVIGTGKSESVVVAGQEVVGAQSCPELVLL